MKKCFHGSKTPRCLCIQTNEGLELDSTCNYEMFYGFVSSIVVLVVYIFLVLYVYLVYGRFKCSFKEPKKGNFSF